MRPEFFDSFDRADNLGNVNIGRHTDKFFSNHEYVLIWFGRIFRGSNRRNAIKLVETIFLNLSSGYEFRVKLPIELANNLILGSIWINGVSSQKFEFDSAITVIEEKSVNLEYSNHFGISKNSGTFEFDLNNYPINGLETDTNSLMVIKQGCRKVLIHPLTFFMAHYGVSKEINRVLLTYLWDDVEEELSINFPDPKTSDITIIPDNCTIPDAVFLHYLKYNEYTQNVVKKLNTRVLKALGQNENQKVPSEKSAPLKVVPYHEQQIEIGFKGINVGDDVILCTEITGMSMPQGNAITYAFSEYDIRGKNFNQGQPNTRSYKPLFHKIDTDEVVIEAESNAGNSTTAILRQRIQTIGEMRKLVKAENITIKQVIQRNTSKVIPLNEPIPSTYAVGNKIGNNKGVGILRPLISSGVVNYQNPSFKKLLKYAQSLRSDFAYPHYNNMIIDAYSKGKLHGETVEHLNKSDKSTNVLAIYVLRIKVSNDVYYLFDCSIATGVNTSGIGIKVNNDISFMSTGVDAVLKQLFENNGRLPDLDVLRKIYGSILNFRHTNSESSNWVATILKNLKTVESEENKKNKKNV